MESGDVMLNGVKVVSEDEYWKGYYDTDDDYIGWANRSVLLEEDGRVIIKGTVIEVGADRPGMSYKNDDSIQVGTFDPKTGVFTKTLG
jgi:hypothetical protein